MVADKYSSCYAVFASTTFWTVFYFLTSLIASKRTPEYWSRVVTLFHGAMVSFYGLNECYGGPSIYDDASFKTTQEQSFIIVSSLGYFIVDFCWCLYYQTESKLMMAHHAYSCFALARLLYRGTGGHATSCGIGAMEATNPLLQARWFIRTHGYHATALFTSIEITFMLLFFIIRIVLGSLYLIFLYMDPNSSWEFRILALVIYIMSWMFLVNISKYVNKKYLQANVDDEVSHLNTS